MFTVDGVCFCIFILCTELCKKKKKVKYLKSNIFSIFIKLKEISL